MSTDTLFGKPLQRVIDFNFDESVAGVFDDMLARSVPGYLDIQKMIGEIAKSFYIEGTNIYDLGCSTGTTLLSVYRAVGDRGRYIGIDYSEPMLKRAKDKLLANNFDAYYDLKKADLNGEVEIDNATVVILNLTLQFIRPLFRDKIISNIYNGLKDDGCLILVEKVLGNNSLINRLFIEYYYNFKRDNGYSDLEISQKRETLENILIPYKLEENFELLQRNGFRVPDVFFKWYNFCGIVAQK